MAAPSAEDVARMRRIIARLRSYGVEVREMPGWETRGLRFAKAPTRIFDHHDASSLKSGEWGSLGLILDGTPRGIPGPLSNFQVARCLDGKPRVAVVAAGFCYHAGAGGPWNELPLNDANPRTYGTEKANDGLGEPYTAAANYATNATFHAAAVESGSIPESFPVGHKEWTPRKSDPLYSMADRRRQVAAFTPNGSPAGEDPLVKNLIIGRVKGEAATYVGDGIQRRHVADEDELKGLVWWIGQKGGDPNVYEFADIRVLGQDVATVALRTDVGYVRDQTLAAIDGLKSIPATSGGTVAQIDYAALAKAINDDADRRARDGNPATGPTS